MDDCYFSYIFSGKTGYRENFSKDISVQIIANALRKYGNKNYIILFRFNKKNEIVLTLWLPFYFKIADLIYPSWNSSIKTYSKRTILLTPRGDFTLKETDKKFIDYCRKFNKK